MIIYARMMYLTVRRGLWRIGGRRLPRRAWFFSSVSPQEMLHEEKHDKSEDRRNERQYIPTHGLFWLSAVCGLSGAMLWQQFWSKHDLPLIPRPQTVKCISGRRSKQYNFLAEAVETAAPSVVYIEKHQVVSTIFGQAMAASSGSGFIVDSSGYVLTNAHVVGGVGQVQVKLQDGRMIKGQVTDIDQIADLALVKLDLRKGETLPALQFGSSGDIRPGEWVVALGSPLSLSNTITAGIVSSVHRPSQELGIRDKPDMEYVQTDAPINVGNSGGPLVNLDGEVIGVNTMTAGPGISFAIPSDFAHQFVQQAKRSVDSSQQLASRYGIGISMLTVTPSIRRSVLLKSSLPSDVKNGVILISVWSNGAADRAGLMKGDVIVSINGRPVRTSQDVHEAVQSGKTLRMDVARRNKHIEIVVHPEPL